VKKLKRREMVVSTFPIQKGYFFFLKTLNIHSFVDGESINQELKKANHVINITTYFELGCGMSH
jgi:hypothetical protein